MSAADVDAYIDVLEEPKRTTLHELRRTLRALLPEADEVISYGSPAYKLQGKTVAGFAAFKDHCSYLPHSGSVFPELAGDLSPYSYSSGALRFPVDAPLPEPLVAKLVEVRRRQAGV